jgi:hypothetical protein
MGTHRNDGAAAPGPVTPGSDEAPALAGAEGSKGNGTADSGDCAAKRLAGVQARAAMLGVELRALDDGAVRLTLHNTGTTLLLPSLAAAESLVQACAAVQRDVQALVARLVRGGS